MRAKRYHSQRYPVLAVLIGGAVVWLLWRRPFRVAVEGSSMVPALEPGDFLVAWPSTLIRRGTLVVVEHPERPGFELVKRVAGTPGDLIGGRILGPDEYWVLGDGVEASTDSRAFGPVARGAIRGVVWLRYWPPGRMSLLTSAGR